MKSDPLISIIVPSYNHYAFLKQRLDSVFNQTYQNIEVILLDDASTDNSVELLNHFQNHPKVSHSIFNEINSGSPFIQWKRGIELAKGEYIWIAESDDVANILFLEETIKFAGSKQDLGLVFVASQTINRSGEVQLSKIRPYLDTDDFSIDSMEEISHHLVKNLVILNASSVLFKAKALKSLDLNKLSSFKNTGDRYAYIQIALKSKIYYLNQNLNYFRNHDYNTTKINFQNNRIYHDRLLICDDLISLFASSKIASTNLKMFYFEQIPPCLKGGYIKEVNKINYKMLKRRILSFKEFFFVFFMSIVSFFLNKKLPYRLEKYYLAKLIS